MTAGKQRRLANIGLEPSRPSSGVIKWPRRAAQAARSADRTSHDDVPGQGVQVITGRDIQPEVAWAPLMVRDLGDLALWVAEEVRVGRISFRYCPT